MPTSEPPVRLFIGSSSEGSAIARNLAAELENHTNCEVTRWDVNVFEPGGYTLDSLLRQADSADFAILVATPDDMVVVRGKESASMRDNVLLELGIFLGALGRERAYLLAPSDTELRIPSDLLGLTRLPYRTRADGDMRAAVNAAVLQVEEQIKSRGHHRPRATEPAQLSISSERGALDKEVERLCANAVAQGWTVKTNNETTLRLRSPRGQSFVLTKGQPDSTRAELRTFASKLRGGGLRVNNSIRRSVEESPL